MIANIAFTIEKKLILVTTMVLFSIGIVTGIGIYGVESHSARIATLYNHTMANSNSVGFIIKEINGLVKDLSINHYTGKLSNADHEVNWKESREKGDSQS